MPTPMANKSLKITAVILVVLALALGYAILRQRRPLTAPETSSSTPAPAPSAQPGALAPSPAPAPSTVERNPDERAVLAIPGPNASEAEKARHFELAQRLARESAELKLVNCVPDPAVFKVANGASFTVHNAGAKDMTVVINPENVYTVPAGGTKTLKAGFGKGAGLFGYGCNSASGGGPGLILVVQ